MTTHTPNMLNPVLIGAASGWGARNIGTELGPVYLKDWGLADKLSLEGLDAPWQSMLHPKKPAADATITHRDDTYDEVLTFNRKLAETVKQTFENQGLPVVLGGDHSCAMGTWSGVVEALNAHEDFGLIWFDAHMDAHTPDTADEGKWGGFYHGMPLAHLFGHGDDNLKSLLSGKTKLNPKHVVLMGIRSYEPGEAALLERLGVRVMMMDEIREKGLKTMTEEAINIASAAKGGFGLTFDLDGLDPDDAPAVGTREKGGVDAAEMLPMLKLMGSHEKFRALEITEFNPERDIDNKTATLMVDLITNTLSCWKNHKRIAQ